MKSSVATVLEMYEAPHFPFKSLSQTVLDLGLEKATTVTGQQFLEANSVRSPPYFPFLEVAINR